MAQTGFELLGLSTPNTRGLAKVSSPSTNMWRCRVGSHARLADAKAVSRSTRYRLPRDQPRAECRHRAFRVGTRVVWFFILRGFGRLSLMSLNFSMTPLMAATVGAEMRTCGIISLP